MSAMERPSAAFQHAGDSSGTEPACENECWVTMLGRINDQRDTSHAEWMGFERLLGVLAPDYETFLKVLEKWSRDLRPCGLRRLIALAHWPEQNVNMDIFWILFCSRNTGLLMALLGHTKSHKKLVPPVLWQKGDGIVIQTQDSLRAFVVQESATDAECIAALRRLESSPNFKHVLPENKEQTCGRDAFVLAVAKDFADTLCFLIQTHKNALHLIRNCNAHGRSLVHFAASQGAERVLERLDRMGLLWTLALETFCGDNVFASCPNEAVATALARRLATHEDTHSRQRLAKQLLDSWGKKSCPLAAVAVRIVNGSSSACNHPMRRCDGKSLAPFVLDEEAGDAARAIECLKETFAPEEPPALVSIVLNVVVLHSKLLKYRFELGGNV